MNGVLILSCVAGLGLGLVAVLLLLLLKDAALGKIALPFLLAAALAAAILSVLAAASALTVVAVSSLAAALVALVAVGSQWEGRKLFLSVISYLFLMMYAQITLI